MCLDGISKSPKMSGKILSTVAIHCVHLYIALTFLFMTRLLASHHLSVMYMPFTQTLVKLYLNHYPRHNSQTEQQLACHSVKNANSTQMTYRKLLRTCQRPI